MTLFIFCFQFEAGLLTTSKVVYAIYLYSEHINKAPAITEVKENFIIIVIINISSLLVHVINYKSSLMLCNKDLC